MFHLVVASYKSFYYAYDYVKKLKRDGYKEAKQLPVNQEGLYRVSINNFNSRLEAEDFIFSNPLFKSIKIEEVITSINDQKLIEKNKIPEVTFKEIVEVNQIDSIELVDVVANREKIDSFYVNDNEISSYSLDQNVLTEGYSVSLKKIDSLNTNKIEAILYHVIISSYKSFYYAYDYVKKLKNDGYEEAKQLPISKEGLYRVSISNFTSRINAESYISANNLFKDLKIEEILTIINNENIIQEKNVSDLKLKDEIIFDNVIDEYAQIIDPQQQEEQEEEIDEYAQIIDPQQQQEEEEEEIDEYAQIIDPQQQEEEEIDEYAQIIDPQQQEEQEEEIDEYAQIIDPQQQEEQEEEIDEYAQIIDPQQQQEEQEEEIDEYAQIIDPQQQQEEEEEEIDEYAQIIDPQISLYEQEEYDQTINPQSLQLYEDIEGTDNDINKKDTITNNNFENQNRELIDANLNLDDELGVIEIPQFNKKNKRKRKFRANIFDAKKNYENKSYIEAQDKYLNY